MIEIVECSECNGRVKPDVRYFRGLPLMFRDETMSFRKVTCECCKSKETYSLHKSENFCSYKCFWSWANKNIPKDDREPIERLKELKTDKEYWSNEQHVKDEILGEDAD